MNVLAAGIWRVAPWLFGCGLLYATATAVVTPILAYGFWEHPERWEQNGWVITAFMAFHWAASTGMLLEALSRGRRRACLAVVGDRLVFLQLGLFSRDRQEWPRALIADLRGATAALGLEGESYQSLQIRLADGSVRQLLEGRPPDELQWIATVLRRTLGMPVAIPAVGIPPLSD